MTCAVKGCGSPHERSRVLCTNCVHSARALVGQSLSTCGICGSGPPEPGRVYCTACAIAWTPLAVSRDPDICRWCLASAGSLPHYTSAGSVRMCVACNVHSAHARAAVNVNGVLHASSVAALPSAAPAQVPAQGGAVTCAVKGCSGPREPGRLFCKLCIPGLGPIARSRSAVCVVCGSAPEPGRALCTSCAIAMTPVAAVLEPDICGWCLAISTPSRHPIGGARVPVCMPCTLSVTAGATLVNGVLHATSVAVPNMPPAPTPVPPPPKPAPTRPRGKPRAQAPVTRYQIKLLPSGAWVGWLEHGLQPVTSAQAVRFDDPGEAAAWAAEKLRGRPCVVEPVEVTL